MLTTGLYFDFSSHFFHSFSASGDRWTEAAGKNNLDEYKKTKLVTNATDKHVSFSFPRFPPFLYVFDLPHFYHQARLRWIGNDVPREDAKWIGGLLARLSEAQIAFKDFDEYQPLSLRIDPKPRRHLLTRFTAI